jgi:hypothetical protein
VPIWPCPALLFCVVLRPTGDTPLRVGAAVTYMLVTRRPLPAPLISDPEVLSGRHSDCSHCVHAGATCAGFIAMLAASPASHQLQSFHDM